MKNRKAILAGTALGMLMAVAPFGAQAAHLSDAQAQASQSRSSVQSSARMILAQADKEDKPAQAQQEPKEPKGEAKPRKRPEKAEAKPAEAEAKPAQAKDAPKAQAKPEPKASQNAAEKEAKPARTEAKPAQAKEAAKADAKPEPKAAQSTAPGTAKQAPKAKPEPKADAKPQPKAAQSTATPDTAKQEAPNAGAKPRPKAAEGASKPERAEKPANAQAKPEQTHGADARREHRAADDKAANPDRKREPAEAAGGEAKQGEKPVRGTARDERKADGKSGGEAASAGDKARPENAAPVLDSQKDRVRDGDKRAGRDGGKARGDRNDKGTQARQEAKGPPPKSDRDAQKDLGFEKLRSAVEEKGKRIDKADRRDRRRHEEGDVVKKLGDRIILNFGDRTIVENTGRERIRRDAHDYYEDQLSGGRVREVLTRPNGVKVVTIRNRNGDIIRRSRIGRDGNETVLVYAGDKRNWDEYHDPAQDLPPLRLTIPASQYILQSDEVRDPDRYYEFLDQPPVEQVDRLYTIDQVKYSSRVRDMVRRVDLDTINFATGSAEISQDELSTLQGVADAMKRLIDDNPGETFLIEGHTDAVGSDNANLALSDERAESVASALTEAFEIPPENLFTQGYGEQYLKVDTDGPNRQNRRVAIRRITPLVSPVANAQ